LQNVDAWWWQGCLADGAQEIIESIWGLSTAQPADEFAVVLSAAGGSARRRQRKYALSKAAKRTHVKVIGYAVMSNPNHLIAYNERSKISKLTPLLEYVGTHAALITCCSSARISGRPIRYDWSDW
jgi:hypothetical protein